MAAALDGADHALAAFAKKAGVSIVQLSAEDAAVFHGQLGYRESDRPNSMVCGFRSERAAYAHWLEGAFGKQTAKAVRALIRKSARP